VPSQVAPVASGSFEVQTLPQLPQLLGSSRVSTHAPAQHDSAGPPPFVPFFAPPPPT
jgi:hypothetical protein